MASGEDDGGLMQCMLIALAVVLVYQCLNPPDDDGGGSGFKFPSFGLDKLFKGFSLDWKDLLTILSGESPSTKKCSAYSDAKLQTKVEGVLDSLFDAGGLAKPGCGLTLGKLEDLLKIFEEYATKCGTHPNGNKLTTPDVWTFFGMKDEDDGKPALMHLFSVVQELMKNADTKERFAALVKKKYPAAKFPESNTIEENIAFITRFMIKGVAGKMGSKLAAMGSAAAAASTSSSDMSNLIKLIQGFSSSSDAASATNSLSDFLKLFDRRRLSSSPFTKLVEAIKSAPEKVQA